MIVHTLKMCTNNAGLEQSLVLKVSKMADNAGHAKQEIKRSPSSQDIPGLLTPSVKS